MKTIIVCVLALLSFSSCKKYLDARPDSRLAVPSSLQDLQSLLDSYDLINSQFPASAEIFSDNYYLNKEDWEMLNPGFEGDFYIWQKNDKADGEWSQPYSVIYTCNLVLENLNAIQHSTAEQQLYEGIKGSALFIRASYYYALAQIFIKCYDAQTASADPGLPLRLVTDYTAKSTRSSVQETYSQIISDFQSAVQLLPLNAAYKTRPSKATGYGALARTYLSMQEYPSALKYADSCLSLSDSLMDYNQIDPYASMPFQRFNQEIIFQSISVGTTPLSVYIAKIDSSLMASYDDNDLRKALYYTDNGDGTFSFKGDYSGSEFFYGQFFTGIATDEIYFIKAECEARAGSIAEALATLNTLLEKRWLSGAFIPLTAENSEQALSTILQERRKELLYRTTRWTDIRRLNKEPEFAKTLIRKLGDDVYTLEPNSDRYVALIPQTVINYSSIPQNP